MIFASGLPSSGTSTTTHARHWMKRQNNVCHNSLHATSCSDIMIHSNKSLLLRQTFPPILCWDPPFPSNGGLWYSRECSEIVLSWTNAPLFLPYEPPSPLFIASQRTQSPSPKSDWIVSIKKHFVSTQLKIHNFCLNGLTELRFWLSALIKHSQALCGIICFMRNGSSHMSEGTEHLTSKYISQQYHRAFNFTEL